MRTVHLLLLSLLLNCKLLAQDIGSKAPAILFSQCLNKNIDPSNFKNKYVVLDFWATWCAPCIASFPHLNDLSKKFASDSVVFAIITSEEANKAAAFLKRRKVTALHLIDSITTQSKKSAKMNDLYGQTAQAFRVRGIPHCVVIDKSGRIRWVGNSVELQEEDLQDILNGRTTTAERRKMAQIDSSRKERERQQAIFQQVKKDTLQGKGFFAVTTKVPYKNGGMSVGVIPERGARYVQLPGHSFDFLCMYFKRIPFHRIQNLLPKTDSSVFLRLEMDSATDNRIFRETAIRLLENTYSIKFQEKKIVATVWELSIRDRDKYFKTTQPIDSLSDHASSASYDQELVYSNFTFQDITEGLENELKAFIVTNKDPAFNKLCDITIPKGSLEAMQRHLLNANGIAMTQVKREIEVVEIVPVASTRKKSLSL